MDAQLNVAAVTGASPGLMLEDVGVAFEWDPATARRPVERVTALHTSQSPEVCRSISGRGGLAPWQERKIRSYVADRLDASVTVGELAKLVSRSSTHFSRAFKQSFGEPPHAYIIRARIERARILMLSTSESLSQIAFACGLADQAHLCRRFRQVTGTTPGAWRRRHAIDR